MSRDARAQPYSRRVWSQAASREEGLQYAIVGMRRQHAHNGQRDALPPVQQIPVEDLGSEQDVIELRQQTGVSRASIIPSTAGSRA